MRHDAIGILMILICSIAVGQQDTTDHLSQTQKIYGLSLFWKEVSYNFAYFDQVPDLDWEKTFQEYIPKVLETKSTFEYYRVLQRFCALLKDGHTNVNMPNGLWERYMDRPALRLNEVQGKPVVTNCSSSLKETLPIGSEILSVAGEPVSAYLVREIFPLISSSTSYILRNDGIVRLLDGPIGSSVAVTIKTPRGETRTAALKRNSRDVTEEWVNERQASRPLTEFRWIREGLAYVALNSFNDDKIVGEFKALLPELYKARGIIIDLRQNGGGSTDNGTAVLDYFTEKPLAGSAWRTREHRASNKAWGRGAALQGDTSSLNARYYLGTVWYSSFHDTLYPSEGRKILVPTVVLIEHHTASAAEDFLVYANKAPHFTKVGRPTYGSTGQPLPFDLPGGGFARVCTKRDTYPDGRDFVGVGIQPDILVEPTVKDLLNHRDGALEKAVEVLGEKMQ